jgi:riboflavin kinase/FMN adenylyltransferase
LCLRFNAALAQLEPEQFIDEVLVQALAARYVVVGDDFRFGRARRGDMTMLRAAGARHGFDAASMPTFDVGGERVSSTRVRQALARGDFADVEALLGRAYRLSGRVVRGEQIGRRIGIPTANIELRRRRIPLAGIFVVEVDGLAPQPLPAVASIGTRPTVGGTEPLLEVHLLDYAKDIYGARISVLFRTKLRDEQRFDSVAEMAQQIQLDIAAARAFFQVPPARSQFHH